MMNISILHQSGIDYEKGVARFLGDADAYERALKTFPANPALDRARECLKQQDFRGVFFCAHELKGSCGSADMTGPYRAAAALCALLLQPDFHPEAVETGFLQLEDACLRAKNGILNAEEH